MLKAIHTITVRQFTKGISSQILQPIITQCLREIQRNQKDFFGEIPNFKWTIGNAYRQMERETVALSSDHAGAQARNFVAEVLKSLRIKFIDFGPQLPFAGKFDFPIWITPALEAINQGKYSRAILCCGSGTGVLIISNKIPGHRAAKATHPKDVVRARAHNNIDVLTVGEAMIADREVKVRDLIKSIILFLSTPFIKNPIRYQKRLTQIEIIQELMLKAQRTKIPSIVESPDFPKKVKICPELADILVVQAQGEISQGKIFPTLTLIGKYLRLGKKSENYIKFLSSLPLLLQEKFPQNAEAQKLISKINRFIGNQLA